MNFSIAALAIVATLTAGAQQTPKASKPTIVLVYGAFADGSSSQHVIPLLVRDGYYVVIAGAPLLDFVEAQSPVYPVPGHFPSDPIRASDMQRRWVEWLDRYLHPVAPSWLLFAVF